MPTAAGDGAGNGSAVTTRLRRLPPERLRTVSGDVWVAVGLGAALAAVAFIGGGGLSLGSATTVQILVTLTGAALVALAVLRARPGPVWGAVSLGLIMVLAVYTALSTAWSVAPSDSWLEANRTLSYAFAFAGGISLARLLPRRWAGVVFGVAIASVAVSVWALLTKVFPGALNPDEIYGRLREPFGYWNAVGLMGGLGVPALLWIGARREGPGWLRAAAFPALGLVLVAVLLSYSRGSLLAIGLGCALWFVVVALRLRGLGMLLTAGAGAGVVIAWAFSENGITGDHVKLSERTSSGHLLGVFLVVMVVGLAVAGLVIQRLLETRPRSPEFRRRAGKMALAGVAAIPVIVLIALAFSSRGVTGEISHGWNKLTNPSAPIPGNGPGRLTAVGSVRARYWREGFKIFDHRPVVGAGAGAYATARTRFRRDTLEVRHAHGYVVQTLADLGLIGLALSLALLAAWLLAAVRSTGRRLAPEEAGRLAPAQGALLTLLSTVVVFGVHSLVDWTWFVPGTAVLALVAAGYLAGRGPLAAPAAAGALVRSRLRMVAAGGVVVLALACAWAIWQPQRSANASDDALAALSDGSVAKARSDALTAHDRNPLSIEPLLDLSAVEQRAGRLPAARQALVRAVRLQPASSNPWRELGDFDAGPGGNPGAGVSELESALYLDPRSVAVQADLILALRAANPPAGSPAPPVQHPTGSQPAAKPPGG